MPKIKIYVCSLTFLFSALTTLFSQENKVHYETNGMVAIEAENFSDQSNTEIRQWYIIDEQSNSPEPDPDTIHLVNASGQKYIEILPDTRVTHDDLLIPGVNFTNFAGAMAVISYQVHFSSPGRYYVWVRAFSTGTEDNGVHVGINNTWPVSGNRMQWCDGKNEWTWESKQRTEEIHCGVEKLIFLDIDSAGLHTIHFSMREDGFEMDKIILDQNYIKPEGLGPDPVYEKEYP